MTIEIVYRSEDVVARIQGNPELWGRGRNTDEAIGDLVRAHPERLGIRIAFPGGPDTKSQSRGSNQP